MKVNTGITREIQDQKIEKDYNYFKALRDKNIVAYNSDILKKRLGKNEQLATIKEYFKAFPKLTEGKKTTGWETPGIYSPEWVKERITLHIIASPSPLDRNSLQIFAKHSAMKFLYEDLTQAKTIIEFFEEMKSVYPEWNVSQIADEHAAKFGTRKESNRTQIQRYLSSIKRRV